MEAFAPTCNRTERSKRLQALQAGFYEMGFFWLVCRDPQRRRHVFHSKVYYPSLDGLVAFVWLESDSNFLIIRSVLLHEKQMRGSATEKDDNQRVLRSLSNEQVLRTWQLAQHFGELRVLRLKMCQHWARYLEQPIAAMFVFFPDSDLAHLAQADLSTGKLRDRKRSPWMQQAIRR